MGFANLAISLVIQLVSTYLGLLENDLNREVVYFHSMAAKSYSASM